MPEAQYDLLIVGGGINGAGIARDAAGQGLRVLLCDKGDLGGATSSASSKLIHGGLRYLEHGEFLLVRKALRERETLLKLAPHIVKPLRFVLPHDRSQRPGWMIRLGLFFYDNLAGRRRLGGSRGVNLRRAPEGAPLRDRYRRGFLYSDCWVDDSRLVVLNCLDAAERGADIRPRTPCAAARRTGEVWEARLSGQHPGIVRARALVNAAGPWVDTVLENSVGEKPARRLRLVKGSHIVVDRLYDGNHAYLLQNDDKRIVFALPFLDRFTLIGTTDMLYEGDPDDVAISDEETIYLCAAVNRYFKKTLGPRHVRWSFAGVRPLYDDGSVDASAVTRDYAFQLDAPKDGAPLLSIYGGKLTTYRVLAEHALDRLLPEIGRKAVRWSGTEPLPGGDIPDGDFETFVGEFRETFPFLPAGLARRYARLYGTRAYRMLRGARKMEDLGEYIGHGLYQAEAEYLRRFEWADTEADILWRRTKLGILALAETGIPFEVGPPETATGATEEKPTTRARPE
ncbi:MAG: glycerol-3-phosphate dehydrogenase [Bauldia litoralis]